MKPESSQYIKKARKLLLGASAMLTINLYEDAGRNAYLAGFNAARAFVYEENDKVFRSHVGLRGEFSRLLKDDPRIDHHMRGFLGRAYNFKIIADYEEGPHAEITAGRATAVVEESKKFVSLVESLLMVPELTTVPNPKAEL
jgi:uncharacterized protein (UPF0332 family)